MDNANHMKNILVSFKQPKSLNGILKRLVCTKLNLSIMHVHTLSNYYFFELWIITITYQNPNYDRIIMILMPRFIKYFLFSSHILKKMAGLFETKLTMRRFLSSSEMLCDLLYLHGWYSNNFSETKRKKMENISYREKHFCPITYV